MALAVETTMEDRAAFMEFAAVLTMVGPTTVPTSAAQGSHGRRGG